MDRSALSDEEQLICALARSQPSDTTLARARTLLEKSLDWQRVVQRALDHDVVAFVYLNLKRHLVSDVPEEPLSTLRSIYHTQFRRSLHIRGELQGLLDHLADSDVDAVPFKGPVLAARAYRDENMRTFTDLDLLVRPEAVDRAVDALHAAGFEEKNPLPDTYETHWSSYSPWHAPARQR